ncbi:MAG: transposase [Methanobrevibacter sp.]|nr:transposase [Candidatus Methanovirga aequatorialis]
MFVSPYNTSKECSVCGYIKPDLGTGIHEWTCLECDSEHDRDINADINILRKGRVDIGWELGTNFLN